jgi:hypothetical protein
MSSLNFLDETIIQTLDSISNQNQIVSYKNKKAISKNIILDQIFKINNVDYDTFEEVLEQDYESIPEPEPDIGKLPTLFSFKLFYNSEWIKWDELFIGFLTTLSEMESTTFTYFEHQLYINFTWNDGNFTGDKVFWM